MQLAIEQREIGSTCFKENTCLVLQLVAAQTPAPGNLPAARPLFIDTPTKQASNTIIRKQHIIHALKSKQAIQKERARSYDRVGARIA